ncbi:MAG: hypothetical protein ACI843_002929, partial [Psychrobacter glaciei]
SIQHLVRHEAVRHEKTLSFLRTFGALIITTYHIKAHNDASTRQHKNSYNPRHF